MKHCYTALAIFIFLSNSLIAQWTKVHTGLIANAVPSTLLEVNQKLLLGSGGTYASTNGGASWDSSSTGLPTDDYGYFRAVKVLQKNGSTIYAATIGGGVYSSSDDGATWSNTGTGLPVNPLMNCMMIHNNSIFVGMDSGRIYRSTDNGAHWTLSNNGINIGWKQVYAFTATSAGIFAGTYLAGAFFSSDNGDNWTQINTGLPAFPAIYQLASIGNDVYASSYGKLFKTTDNGTNWTDISSVLPTNYGGGILQVHGTTLFIATAAGIYRSTDNGAGWSLASTGIPANSNVVLVTSTGSKLISYVVRFGAGHICTSTNNGDSWDDQGSYPVGCSISKMAISGNYLLVGTHDVGLIRTPDNGDHWENTSFPTNVRTIAAKDSIVLASYYIVLGTDSNVAAKSTDYGTTWTTQRTRNGLPNEGLFSYGFSGSYAFMGTSNNTGASGVYRTTNKGENWTLASTGLTSIPGATAFTSIGTNVFAGVTNILGGQGVYISTNYGGNWTSASNGLPSNSTVGAFAVNGSTLYAAITSKGIFKTTDNGTNWTDITPPTALTYNTYSIATAGNCLFASFVDLISSGNGVFVSTNGGTSWSPINEGLPDLVSFSEFAVNDTFIFVAGTNAIYKRRLSDYVTGVREINNGTLPSKFSLEQNYPNPFNPSTVIRYSLSENSVVTLKVYNILGEEIETLLENKNQNQGSYETTFDAGKQSSGIYYYRFTASNIHNGKNFSVIKSMILIK